MNTSPYIYNNEAISIIAIIAVLEKLKQIDIAKIMLILPLLYHKRTLNYLLKLDTNLISLEEFAENNILFSNFNDRFSIYLPIAINAITILEEMNLINIDSNKISYKPDNIIDINNPKLGNRAKSIVAGAFKLSNILEEETNNLYFQLRITL